MIARKGNLPQQRMRKRQPWLQLQRLLGVALCYRKVLSAQQHARRQQVRRSPVGREAELRCKGSPCIVIPSRVDVTQRKHVVRVSLPRAVFASRALEQRNRVRRSPQTKQG